MKNLLTLTWILGVLAAGCAWERSTAPKAQEPAWNLVRFHETAGGSAYRDVSVLTNGELTLVDGRGDGAPARGLLAGERLETLARLIDALPPQSYAFPTPCASDGFFVSVTRGGEVLSYASASCDPAPPASLADLRGLFDELATEVLQPKTDPVAFSVLAAGTASAIHVAHREVLRDRAGLLRVLEAHRGGEPVALPAVDFRRQIVVAEFLGDRPTSGYAVGVDGVEKSDSGWLRVHFTQVAPGDRCAVAAVVTQPFVLVAVSGTDANVLFETASTETRCE